MKLQQPDRKGGQSKRQKAKGKNQKAKGKNQERGLIRRRMSLFLPFFCLLPILPFAFLTALELPD